MPPVPSQRLLWLAACTLPLALLPIVQPALGWVLPAALAALGLGAMTDLWRSRDLLRSLHIEAEPICRLARDHPGELTIHLRTEAPPPGPLTLGLPLPFSFLQPQECRTVTLRGDGVRRWSVSWPLTARARGVFRLPPMVAETLSCWGLFQLRQRFEPDGEIRVYPNLRPERRRFANLFLNRGTVGLHAQRVIGQGREYEQLRDYAAGDQLFDIHWKASAKRAELVTKTYQIERTQEVYCIIDHGRLSALRAVGETRSLDDDFAETLLERYLTAASVLAMAAQQEGDHFGLIAFGRTVSRFIRAGHGTRHTRALQDALFDLRSESGPANFDELFRFLGQRLRRRTLLIFLTDLADPAAAEDFQHAIGRIAGRHLVLVNCIRRAGVRPLFEGHPPANPVEEIAGHLRWESLRLLRGRLQAAGVRFALLDDEKLSVGLVNQYLSVRRRQLL
ncbi:MAG: DUF58 domain-containing protein [Puniceicoccaceae bacterium]|nr:MAG: DUF58 domain-containing protein [Puniceicoccaceae bacterium]